LSGPHDTDKGAFVANYFNKKNKIRKITTSEHHQVESCLSHPSPFFSFFSDTKNRENFSILANKATTAQSVTEASLDDKSSVPEDMLNILGKNPASTKKISVTFNQELKVRWENWIKKGFPEEDKIKILEKYPRKGELFVDAPKINIEIIPVMSDIAKKRDGHFTKTQNSVSSVLSALGAASSMILSESEDGVDQDILMTYLCDAGKLMIDVFHQY